MKNDTYLNILASFAYIATCPSFLDALCKLAENGTINLMIDSGAFTRYNARGGFEHINLPQYCEFLKTYAKYSEKYVMLDVVGNAKESRHNYEEMIKAGLNPMFVLTMFDNDWDYMLEAVYRNADICVAGGATTKSAWLTNRFINI